MATFDLQQSAAHGRWKSLKKLLQAIVRMPARGGYTSRHISARQSSDAKRRNSGMCQVDRAVNPPTRAASDAAPKASGQARQEKPCPSGPLPSVVKVRRKNCSTKILVDQQRGKISRGPNQVGGVKSFHSKKETPKGTQRNGPIIKYDKAEPTRLAEEETETQQQFTAVFLTPQPTAGWCAGRSIERDLRVDRCAPSMQK